MEANVPTLIVYFIFTLNKYSSLKKSYFSQNPDFRRLKAEKLFKKSALFKCFRNLVFKIKLLCK